MNRIHRSMSADISELASTQIIDLNEDINYLQWWNSLSGVEQQKWLTTFISHAKFSNNEKNKPKFYKKDRNTLYGENFESIPKRRVSTPRVEDFNYYDIEDYDSKCSTPVLNNFMDRVKPSPFSEKNERKTFSRN